MANEVTTKTIISLENLQKYDTLVKKYVDDADKVVDAKSLKSLAVVGDNIYFFKSETVPMTTGEDPAVDTTKKAYSVAISSSDVTTLKSEMLVVQAATAGYNAENTIANAISAVSGEVSTLDNSLASVAKSGKASDVTVEDADEKITATTVEGALVEIATSVSTLDSSLKAVAKSGAAADVSIADESNKFTATTVEGALLENANAIGTINTNIGTVAEGKTVMGEIGDIQDKLDDIEDGAQVNIIEEIQFNGTKITPADKVVNVVVPKETTALTAAKIIDSTATEGEDAYHGSADNYATSKYVYDQLSGIMPQVISKINGVFDIAGNIKYITVDTKAALNAVDMSEVDAGVYIYLVKQDESMDARVPADEEAGTAAEYYTTMYIYSTADREAGFEFIGKLNVSEAMLEGLITTAIKNALYTTVTVEEEEVEVTKFYTRTEGATVAAGLTAEVTRATTAEGGLDTRLQAVESAVGEGGSVATQIQTEIEKLDAEVTNTIAATPEVPTPVQPDVQISITESDGKLTAVTATVTANTFDAYGSASTAESNAKSYADSLYSVATEAEINALFETEEE